MRHRMRYAEHQMIFERRRCIFLTGDRHKRAEHRMMFERRWLIRRAALLQPSEASTYHRPITITATAALGKPAEVAGVMVGYYFAAFCFRVGPRCSVRLHNRRLSAPLILSSPACVIFLLIWLAASVHRLRVLHYSGGPVGELPSLCHQRLCTKKLMAD